MTSQATHRPPTTPEEGTALKIDFIACGGETTRGEFTPAPEHAGLGQIVHGGILVTFAEDVACIACGSGYLSTHLEMDFRAAAYVDEKLTGSIVEFRRQRNHIFASVDITSATGVIAKMKMTLVRISRKKLLQLARLPADELAPEPISHNQEQES